ncbi:MAG TPA: phospholipase D family protein [Caldimonas sp.]|nr:phospholipase D family protein [Caldimonas sp.]HEX2541640.1 phospholipase D family protein [Caldimonas sp.]
MRPEVPSSVAIAASADTRLGRVAAASMPPPPESGARLVHSGTLALDARLALIRTAERSLDVQYYQVADDHTGRGFLRELGAAAARGVRVRLLLDDLHTGEQQATLVALASLANVQLRVFNPLPVRHGSWPWRLLASWPDIGRLQMRMHNKLLVADGAFALTGGRNIADEYYWQSETSAFIDLDVVVAGPVVADLAALFDLYWNSEQVWPLLALVRPDGGFAEQRRRFDAAVADARLPTVPRVALDRLGYGRLRDEIEGGRVRLHAGRARAVADLPQKVDDGPFVAEDLWDAPSEIRRVVNGVMRAAVSETFLITPYAVPGEIGVARTTVNHERGVRIRILTNSLASTDEPLVHVGYRRYRKRMIEAGAELYEVDPVPTERLAWPELRGRPVLRIHTKAAVVDQRITYIGSMNFDPRSVALNTETGVLIESQALAAEVLGLLEPLMAFGAWQVRLDADGQLQWARTGFDAPPLRSEPRTGLWQRLQLLLFGALVPESVL